MASLLWNRISKLDRFEKIGLFLFVLGHACAAYFSFGYNHPDEHFQILEFADYFIGLKADSSSLPWEFRSQIRPWFQPFLHALPMKLLLSLGWYQAFDLLAAFRVLYAALNLAALWSLWRVFKDKFAIDPKWFLLIGTLWFFPYLHVRNSSENLSGIFLTFAFAVFFGGGRSFLCGLLFGFAFLARYQIALGLAGFALAILARERRITGDHLRMLGGFLIVVGLGAVLDRIGYGNWVLAPYLYFKVNLVDGLAATFNPYPWYQYFIWILQLNPVVSLPLFLGILVYAKKEKIDPLAGFVLTFMSLHFLITNKEYRFFFPLMNLVVLMSIRAFQDSPQRWFSAPYLTAYLGTSILGFYVSTFHGAALGSLWCIHTAHRFGSAGETWLSNRDFVSEFRNNYYRLDQIRVRTYGTEVELSEALKEHSPPTRVMIDAKISEENTGRLMNLLRNRGCEVETSALPDFVFSLRDRFPFIDKIAYRALYRCP